MSTKTVTIEVKTQLEWKAARSSTSSAWIGVCEPLNIVIEADTLDELHSIIPETLHLMFFDLLSDNELNQFLTDRGWHARNLPHDHGTAEDIEFDVPWQLIAGGAGDPTRRHC